MTDKPDTPIQPPIPPFEEDEYFTCQCNPPFESQREDGFYAHRIPIDCMTAEDWQRVARAKPERAKTVYVVTSLGDQDCGFPNEGVLGVFVEEKDAWTLAFATGSKYAGSGRLDWGGVSGEGIELGRGDILVQKMEVKGDPDSEPV